MSTNTTKMEVRFTVNQLNKMMERLVLEKLNNISEISQAILDKKFPGHRGDERDKFVNSLNSNRAWVFGAKFQIESISNYEEVRIKYQKSLYSEDIFYATIKLSDLQGSDRDIAKRARKFYYEAKHDILLSDINHNNYEISAAKEQIKSLNRQVYKWECEVKDYKHKLDKSRLLYEHYVNGAQLVKDKGSEYEKYKNSKSE